MSRTTLKDIIYIVLALIVVSGGVMVYQNYSKNNYSSGIGIGGGAPTQSSNKKVTVMLPPIDAAKFDQAGIATLEEVGNQLKVTLQLNKPSSVSNSQPAHIHSGSCPNVGDIIFSFNNVVDGKSETYLNTSLAALKSQEPIAINVHKSDNEPNLYTACGNIEL